MGQVTVFTRDDCTYCARVLEVMERCIEAVKREDPEARISLKIVDCRGANAAMCVRLTGSFTVPHVFMQDEYIGDCSTTCALAKCESDCNLIMNKLRAIARAPAPSPAFPPLPDAQMVKVTDTTACSSMPTPEQVRALGTFGLRSVVNLIDERETCFDREEASHVAAGVQYIHAPLLSAKEPTDLKRALDAVAAAPKPVLVHCDTGVRAGLVSLLAAARETDMASDATPEQIIAWGCDMGLELKPFASVAARVLSA